MTDAERKAAVEQFVNALHDRGLYLIWAHWHDHPYLGRWHAKERHFAVTLTCGMEIELMPNFISKCYRIDP